ncbi:MAG: hypothetical protein JO215_05285 [Ktedonobacteraceae bacterium]|nr:hypothetical protein [Ktedonobacteraceae bacterium]
MVGRLSWNTFWQVAVFRITIAVSILFFLLTVIAMLLYPGGTITDPHVHGYSFFLNFLSDLGRISTPSGQPNLISRMLFTFALSMGAVAVALFFVALTQFFPGSGMAPQLSRLGAICGLVTSVCFIGVAFVPLDLSSLVHYVFLDVALVSFLLAFLLLFLAVLLTPGFPRRVVWVFSAFAVLLAAYSLLLLFLLLFGPKAGTLPWEIIQATGQKIIVYASILTALVQAFNMQPLLLKNAET